jgi:catechol 2,3-dioxygenase-like lactoylglutathione lyase family enzyme
MDAWADGLGAVTLFVDDLGAAREFYLRAFGLPVVFEDENSFVLRLDRTVINVLVATQAPEVVDPVPVAPASAGTRALLTVDVATAAAVDRVAEALTAAGVPLVQEPVDRPWGVRTVTFADLDGHVWEVAAPVG